MADSMKVYKRKTGPGGAVRPAEEGAKGDALEEILKMMQPEPSKGGGKESQEEAEQEAEGGEGAEAEGEQPNEGEQESEAPAPEPDHFHKAVMAVAEKEQLVSKGDVEAMFQSLPNKPGPSQTIIVRQDEQGAEIERAIFENMHELFGVIVERARLGQDFLLIGPAGCGKTRLVYEVAAALKKDFDGVSCSSGMSKSELSGWLLPNKDGGFGYVGTSFVRVVEGGGLFLMDEIDAADANVLLILNQLLANGRFPIPSRHDNPTAHRHAEFVLGAAANTFGRGANRMYVGRNQLDEATLDRFACNVFEMDYDRKLEERIIGNDDLRHMFWAMRDAVEAHKLRRIVSTRAMLKAQVLIEAKAETLASVKERFLSGWTDEERTRVGAGPKR